MFSFSAHYATKHTLFNYLIDLKTLHENETAQRHTCVQSNDSNRYKAIKEGRRDKLVYVPIPQNKTDVFRKLESYSTTYQHTVGGVSELSRHRTISSDVGKLHRRVHKLRFIIK